MHLFSTKIKAGVQHLAISSRMGGISTVRLPACLTPSVYMLIRVRQKMSLVVNDGVVNAIREQDLLKWVFGLKCTLKDERYSVYCLFSPLVTERNSSC